MIQSNERTKHWSEPATARRSARTLGKAMHTKASALALEWCRRMFPRAVKALWFALYSMPIAFLLFPWLSWLPERIDIFVARTSLPDGLIVGLIWVILNVVIFLVSWSICMIPLFLLVAIVWKIEELIVTSWLSPRLRKLLELETYVPPLSHWRRAKTDHK